MTKETQYLTIIAVVAAVGLVGILTQPQITGLEYYPITTNERFLPIKEPMADMPAYPPATLPMPDMPAWQTAQNMKDVPARFEVTQAEKDMAMQKAINLMLSKYTDTQMLEYKETKTDDKKGYRYKITVKPIQPLAVPRTKS
ncbi:hypothetical protein HY486_01020 [Candidatus Woesearchaeota archaeon]|nr:hypothetical protein [Candidatus Woesearchaeota archaeon]